MPIRREHRFFYPIDWPQLSATIRFGRAGGACEGCGRPHGRTVYCLSDGRWWDAAAGTWRDGRGRTLPALPTMEDLGAIRSTRVVLATAHRDHDTANNAPTNLAAFCQRCHINHDRPEHRRRRWLTLFRRKAMGDLFLENTTCGTKAHIVTLSRDDGRPEQAAAVSVERTMVATRRPVRVPEMSVLHAS